MNHANCIGASGQWSAAVPSRSSLDNGNGLGIHGSRPCVRTCCGWGHPRSENRLFDLRFESFQRPPNQPAQPALRQTLGERIHRRNAVDVDETLLAAFDDLGFGMVHRARLGLDEFAENENCVADREILFHERYVLSRWWKSARSA